MNNYTDSNINKLPTALKLITDAKLTGKDDKQYINRNGELTSLAKSTLKNKLILQEIEKDIKKSPEEYLQKSEDSHKKLSTNALATHIIRQHILPEQFTRILPAEQNKRILDLLEDIQKDLGIDGNAVIANIKVDDGTNKYHKFINELKILSISTSITTWDMLMNSFTPVKVEADSDGDIYEECIEIHATNIYLAYMTSGNHWLDSIDIVLLDNYFRSAKTQEQNMPLELETMLSNNLVNTYINKSNHWTPDTITNKEIPTVASDGNCGITSVLFVYSELENKVVAS